MFAGKKGSWGPAVPAVLVVVLPGEEMPDGHLGTGQTDKGVRKC